MCSSDLGLGREPLEHYVGKIDGYRNSNENIEYFIDVVAGVTVGPPFSAQLTFDDGTGGQSVIKVENMSIAEQILEKDPAILEGVFTATIHPWLIAFE